MHVHFFDENAVSGDTVALAEEDNVTNDQLANHNSLGGAILTTEDSTLLVHDFAAEAEELFLLTPVAEGLDESSEEHSEVDRDGLEPLPLDSLEEADHQGDRGEDQKEQDVELVELVP